MKYGLSMKKIKELMGGSSGASGISSWEEWGSVTGKEPITLPTKFTEIKVVTTIDTYSFTKTITYDEIVTKPTQTLYDSNFSATSHASNRSISWSISGGKIQMAYVYHNGTEISSSVVPNYTTTLYYKRAYENVVNVGTESNWELWGKHSITYSGNYKALPNEWEEIMFVIHENGAYPNTITTLLNKDMYKTLYDKTLSTGNYSTIHLPNSIQLLLRCSQNDVCISKNSGSYDYTFEIYYKKKCDNVLDINDMGEWKYVGSFSGSSTNYDYSINEDYKELLVTVDNTSVGGSIIINKGDLYKDGFKQFYIATSSSNHALVRLTTNIVNSSIGVKLYYR